MPRRVPLAAASQDDWRRALTATERFNNIQSIEKAARLAAQPAALTASAVTLENEAYLSSTSRDDYDAACDILSSPPSGDAVRPSHEPAAGDSHAAAAADDSGTQIGTYQHCHYLASGTSADVYRSGAVALKVCTIGNDCAPHSVDREAKILKALQKPCIPLLETFHDAEQQIVLVLPYMPLTLQAVLHGSQGGGPAVTRRRLQNYFVDIFSALAQIHSQGIIHRDIKPSAVLLASIDGPAYLSDFGTAWHPTLSAADEPADEKVLDIGTGPYRAPEVLFGHQAYGPTVDMWAVGAMLAESARPAPHKALFESRAVHEDGNQLGLILSIFKTIGTPTLASWPEAATFRTPPFEMYRMFEPQAWETVLADVDADVRAIVAGLVRYNSTRMTAEEARTEIQNLRID